MPTENFIWDFSVGTGDCLVRAGSDPIAVEATLDLDSLNEYRESFPVLDGGRPELEPLLP